MKYSDGGWLFKEGYEVKFAVHVYDTRQTMEVKTPREDIIGVKLYNYKGVQAKTPDFELFTEKITPIINENEEIYTFQSGKLRAEITKGENLTTAFYYEDRLLTSSNPRSKALVVDPTGKTHISDQLNIGVGELVLRMGKASIYGMLMVEQVPSNRTKIFLFILAMPAMACL